MNVLAGEAAVDRGERVKLVLKEVRVLGVEEDAGKLGAVGRDAGPLAGDLRGEDEVLEDLLVDDGKGPRAGALLLDARVAGRLAEHAALSKEDDVAVGELG